MKLPIRFFGVGLLTASIIFSITLYFFNDKEANLDEISIEDLSAYLETEGYHVITQEQYISFAVFEREQQIKQNEEDNEAENSTEDNEDNSDKNVDEESNKDSNKDSNNNENEENKDEPDNDGNDNEEENSDENNTDNNDGEKEVHSYTLTVKENMLAPDVGKLLENNKIVENATEFANYLVQNNYSRFIQLGDHKLTSDMSHYEIAEKITSN